MSLPRTVPELTTHKKGNAWEISPQSTEIRFFDTMKDKLTSSFNIENYRGV